MKITPVAIARNGFTDKFGIPRQSREESCIETRIVFEPDFRVREALRGIEGYSHLWLIWGFSRCAIHNAQSAMGIGETPDWSPTVRPPRLGGNVRMGVFATRSPFRPNALGLSSVRLLRIEDTTQDGLVLVVSGADLLDGTPIYDIKPYLSYSDSHPEARNGFGEATSNYHLAVDVSTDVWSLLWHRAVRGRPCRRYSPKTLVPLTSTTPCVSIISIMPVGQWRSVWKMIYSVWRHCKRKRIEVFASILFVELYFLE